jgi:Tfp pilus assembly protein PilN
MTETVEAPAVAAHQTAPQRVEWALIPRVNLLPAEILEARRFRRVQALLLTTVVAAVGVSAAATWWAQTQVDTAREELAAATSEVSRLQAEQAEYAEAPRVIAQVDAATAARRLAMARDVLWYRYMGDLASALPNSVTVDSFTITISDVPVAGGTAAPLTSPGIGTVSVEGKASRFAGVSSWMEALEGLPGTNATTLTTAARDGGEAKDDEPVVFTSGATVTQKALSRRFERKAG